MTVNEHIATAPEHALSTEDGGEPILVEIGHSGPVHAEVLMIPGMFTARGFWISPKGIGLAAFLADAGMRCWILERRGIGAASADRGARLGLREAARYDIPAACAHIKQQGSAPLFLLGHSFGGVLAARSLAEHLPADSVRGLITFAAQCEVGKPPLHPPGSWLTTAVVYTMGRLPARLAGLGPQDEPKHAVMDAIAWTTQAQRDGSWLQSLHQLPLSQLALAGAGDDVDPPAGCERFAARMASADATYTLLSKDNGWAQDYSHPGMVVSRDARDEVWPMVRDWINARL